MFLQLVTPMLHLLRVQRGQGEVEARSVLQVLPAGAWAGVTLAFGSLLQSLASHNVLTFFITKPL
jgi:hypothetical protein